MRKLAAGLVLVVASMAQAQVTARPAASDFPAAKKFSVVIEHNGTQWRARCELGCRWTNATLTFACKDNCDAVLDFSGLVTAKSEPGTGEPFSILLSAFEDGSIIAKPRAGTQWQRLGWSCAKQPCTARVTEAGVAVMGQVFDITPTR